MRSTGAFKYHKQMKSSGIRGLSKIGLLTALVNIGLGLSAQENCFNGIDDTGNGLIDLNDTEACACEFQPGAGVPSLIPNPSFEEFSCCPDAQGQLFCAEGWEQATIATTDYLNTCGFPSACMPLPLPDGNGIAGALYGYFWNGFGIATDPFWDAWFEYVGACLLSELEAGVNYTLQFYISAISTNDLLECAPADYDNVNVTLYGLETCPEFPVPTLGCPEPFGWIELGFVAYEPIGEWTMVSINFSPPTNINAILLGPPCDLDVEEFNWGMDNSNPGLYCMYDNLVLNESSQFEFPNAIIQQGGNCQSDLVLSIAVDDNFSLQWYYEGVALVGETNPALNLGATGYPIGMYQVRITNELTGNCAIIETIVDTETNSPLEFQADVQSGCAPLEVNFTNLTDTSFAQAFLWNFQTGNSTALSPTHTFDQPGLFDITLTAVTPANCTTNVSFEAFIEVLPSQVPQVNISTLNGCAPYQVLFTGDFPGTAQCIWDFGDLGLFNTCAPELTFEQSGLYSGTLTLAGNAGCSLPANFSFMVASNNPPFFEITGPPFICADGKDSLLAIFENGVVEWFDGSAEAQVPITGPGTYACTFTRNDGCSVTNVLTIPERLPPSIQTSDRVGCEGETLQLLAEANGSRVRWLEQPNMAVLTVNESGVYTVVAENECGISQREVQVTLNDCECHVYIPNSFSPNGDGINDLFRPSISCELRYYELLIFDRWGREIFRSKDPIQSWNGTGIKNDKYLAASQMFNYILRYDNALRPVSNTKELRGSILLVR